LSYGGQKTLNITAKGAEFKERFPLFGQEEYWGLQNLKKVKDNAHKKKS